MSTTGRRVGTGVVLILLVVALLVACSGGSSGHQVIKGIFKDASPLEVGSEVRADGVLVGKVDTIRLDRSRGVAIVALDVDKKVLPVHQDATMTIKPVNLLGENYVQLDPGTPSKAYMTGSTIPVKQTINGVTLQGVLDTFDDPTSAGLAALVLTTGQGMQGNGKNTADAIKALAPAMNQIDRLGKILRDQNSVLNSLIEKSDPVAAAVSKDNGKSLDHMIGSLTATLEVTRDKQEAIAKTLDELPATLAEARQTFSSLETVSNELGPTLEKARPVTDDLSQISDEITNFSKDADPAFNGFDKLFKNADKLLKEAAPVATSLKEHGSQLDDISTAVDSASQVVLAQHRRELMTFVRYWALSTNSRDAASHYFRGVFHVTPNTLQQLLGSDNPINIGKVDPLGGAGSEGAAGKLVGDINKSLGNLTKSLGGGGGSSNSKSSPSDSGATGLSPTQEQSLLGQLLGGL
ncbi:MAG: Phospholipid/cholesterol/gamma-HCH transport system substrate-binding protein [Aeromicrobium sp.]|nr:Phospholipid/cholesterol/gamma-HCH transport system substrate-binding protein [Aeromicrobium sp.]